MRYLFTIIMVSLLMAEQVKSQVNKIRIGVAGLTHTHVHWILGRAPAEDIEIVGIAEPNRELAERYITQHGLSRDLYFTNLDEMIDRVKPDAVTAFGTIFEHLEVVEKCAPRGIHVMVEKPLAVNLEHATKMKALAEKHNILLLTNYETTWYATNHRAYELVHSDQAIGPLRKIVVHDGHKGPEEIGVNEEFLVWLKDPKLNGGGAITDFGCYGANLITWLMKGQRPHSVTAVTQTIKPDKYPKVDDEATLILTYPETQGIIQASWNWPIARKDMEVYGRRGQIMAYDRHRMTYQVDEETPQNELKLSEREYPFNDPLLTWQRQSTER